MFVEMDLIIFGDVSVVFDEFDVVHHQFMLLPGGNVI